MYQVSSEQIHQNDIFNELLRDQEGQTSQEQETQRESALYPNIEFKRNSNTIAKIGRLRVRKELIIIAQEIEKEDANKLEKIKKTPKNNSKIIKEKLREIFKKENNNASFGKMIVLAQKQFLITSLQKKWPNICEKFLAKKLEKMGCQTERYDQLKESLKRITACLQLEDLHDIELVAKTYWGEFRQKGKFGNCVAIVHQYKDNYERDDDQNSK